LGLLLFDVDRSGDYWNLIRKQCCSYDISEGEIDRPDRRKIITGNISSDINIEKSSIHFH
jgi:hypothetical protein